MELKNSLTFSWSTGGFEVHIGQALAESKERCIVIDPAAPDVLHHLSNDVHSACCATLLGLQLSACNATDMCEHGNTAAFTQRSSSATNREEFKAACVP